MRHIVTFALIAVLAVAGVWAVAWAMRRDSLAPALPPGDQEIAWIHAATSGPAWERFVAGVARLRRDWPQIQVDDRRAFLEQTTAVPEVVIGLAGVRERLHIRWYKLTSETDNAYWVRRLSERRPAPLAFIGGGTSERAVELARALAAHKAWPGPAPLLLITTATANTLYSDPAENRSVDAVGPTPLMDVYPGRSFRFCFTNRQMAQAVVDFIWSQPELRPTSELLPALGAISASALDPWLGTSALAVQIAAYPPTAMALEWDDDPYSIDLARQFHEAFHQAHLPTLLVTHTRSIPCSVGGFYRPNAWEAQAAEFLLDALHDAPRQRQVLTLPASAGPARRVLRTIAGVRPLAGRNLVAVTGDSININNVYRDADIVWNSRAIPVPLVFFAHQNPVAWDPESADPAANSALLPPTGTDEVLLHRDLVRLVMRSVFAQLDSNRFRLVTDADELAARLRSQQPSFFDASGDRRGGQGEHIVAVRPQFAGGAPVLTETVLEVWTRDDAAASAWRRIERLVIEHGQRFGN